MQPTPSACAKAAEDTAGHFIFAELSAGLDNSDHCAAQSSEERWSETLAGTQPSVTLARPASTAATQTSDSYYEMGSAQPPPDSPNSEKARGLVLTSTLTTSTRSRMASTEVPSPRVYSAYEPSPANLAKEYHRYDPDIELSNSSEFGGCRREGVPFTSSFHRAILCQPLDSTKMPDLP